jgi:DNA-binding MarR family transcriptional regulator
VARTPDQGMSLDLFYSRAGHLIRRLNQISVALFLQETADLGLTSVQYAALNVIEQKPGIDQVTLSRMAAFDKTTLVKVLNRLVEKGLVTRKVSATDRRRHVLNATKKGRDIVCQIVPMIDRSDERILAPLTAQERRTFLKLASRLVHVNNLYSRAPMHIDLIERNDLHKGSVPTRSGEERSIKSRTPKASQR